MPKAAMLLSALALVLISASQADARKVAYYWCLAQDTTWSYPGQGDTRVEAQRNAMAYCQRTSEVAHACYHHRCEKRFYDIPDPVRPRPRPIPVPPEDRNSCSFDSQCSFDQVCESGQCIAKRDSRNSCSWASQCGFGKVCNDGMCMDDNDFDNRCTSDFQCGTFGKCENFKCIGH